MISDQFSVISFNKGCNADGADDTDLRGFLWFEIISTKYSSLQLVILTKERSHHAIKKTIWKQLLKVIRFDKIAQVCHSVGIYYGREFFKIKSAWKEIIRDSSRVTNYHELESHRIPSNLSCWRRKNHIKQSKKLSENNF